MRDNIIDRIGINNTGVYSINARFGVGKTSLACILTSELYLTGKNVLFLTEETSVKTIQRKFSKLINVTDYRKGGILIKSDKDLVKAMDSVLIKGEFDVIVVDGSINTIDCQYCKKISQEKNVIIIVTNYVNDLPSAFQDYNKTTQYDMIIGIDRIKHFEFWEDIKYRLCFWLKRPNRTINILKNRFGKESSFKINIDFKTLKIR